jgi:hypothetical protein
MSRVTISQTVGDPVLTYATGVRGVLSPRGWRVLFGLGAVHLAAALVLLASSVPSLLRLAELIQEAPRGDWFVRGMLAQTMGLFVMVFVNGLAVAGYWIGSRGGSPRRWFLIYVPTQLSLIVLLYAVAIALTAASPHQISPTSSVGVSWINLLIWPAASVVLNLPLFLLLFRRIRRACFG